MKQHPILSFSIAGACAGAVNGLLGALKNQERTVLEDKRNSQREEK